MLLPSTSSSLSLVGQPSGARPSSYPLGPGVPGSSLLQPHESQLTDSIRERVRLIARITTTLTPFPCTLQEYSVDEVVVGRHLADD